MGAALDLAAIGARLRTGRESRGLTLDQLAAISGVSKAHLSRLESGDRHPSIAVLVELARALGVRIGSLVGEDVEDTPLTSFGPDVPRHTAAGLEIASVSGYANSRALEAMRVVVPASRPPTAPVRHRGEEWLYIARGILELEYDGVLYELVTETAAHFDASRPHRMTTRRGSAEVLLVTAADRTELAQIHH